MIALACRSRTFALRVGRLPVVALAAAIVASGCSSEPASAPAAPVRTVPVSQPGLVTVTGKAPRGTVVALEAAAGQPEAPVPPGVIMDQRGQQFIPDLLVARVGQTVEFRNGEGIPHNVYVTRGAGGAVELNVSTDPGQGHAHTFSQTGLYEVSCDIHPSMRASIVVVNTPYHAISGDFGSYVIMNVPPGRYQLVTSYGNERSERVVEVAGEHAAIDSRGD